jgi:hypothetical protein
MRVRILLEEGKKDVPFATFDMPVIGPSKCQLIAWATAGLDGLSEFMCVLENDTAAHRASQKATSFTVRSAADKQIVGRGLKADEALALQERMAALGLETEIV